MALLNIQSLDEVQPDDAEQLFAELAQLMQEKYPEVELRRGPFHDHLLHLSSVLAAVNVEHNRRGLDQASLLKIVEGGDTVAPEVVDAVLSNYLIERRGGAQATGTITMVVDANVAVIVPSNLRFTTQGQTFIANDAYVGRPAGSAIQASTDRLLTPLGDGTYAFTIDATAEVEGATGNIKRGTKLTPQSPPSRFVTAYASSDFRGGAATESNTDLLRRLRRGIAARQTEGGQEHLEAMIFAQEQFEQTVAYSVAGYGDPEQTRDQHWIFPASGGGKVDIYARTSQLPRATSHLLEATLVEITPNGGVWQFAIDKDLAPGFYRVEKITAPDAGPDDTGYEITVDQRGMDFDGETFKPDIVSTGEAAYTRYQTAVIRFLDPDRSVVNLAVGAAAVYQAVIVAMPLIAELQDFLNLRRSKASDILVRAAVPCFLSLSFEVRKDVGESDPDTGAIANALAARVNQLGFTGQLHASLLADVIHDFLSGRQAVGAIDMFGRIYAPDGTILFIRDPSILKIPDTPSRYVTGRTTAFILNPSDISIRTVVAGYTEG